MDAAGGARGVNNGERDAHDTVLAETEFKWFEPGVIGTFNIFGAHFDVCVAQGGIGALELVCEAALHIADGVNELHKFHDQDFAFAVEQIMTFTREAQVLLQAEHDAFGWRNFEDHEAGGGN